MCSYTKQEIENIQEENLELKIALEEIEKRLRWVPIDCHEADKVLCHVQSIKSIITNVYPKYSR